MPKCLWAKQPIGPWRRLLTVLAYFQYQVNQTQIKKLFYFSFHDPDTYHRSGWTMLLKYQVTWIHETTSYNIFHLILKCWTWQQNAYYYEHFYTSWCNYSVYTNNSSLWSGSGQHDRLYTCARPTTTRVDTEARVLSPEASMQLWMR